MTRGQEGKAFLIYSQDRENLLAYMLSCTLLSTNRLKNSQAVRASSCFKRTFMQEIANALDLMSIHKCVLKSGTKLSEKG